jgi:hypothetical protein
VRTGDLLFETLVLRPRVPAAELAVAWRRAGPRGLIALSDFEGGALWVWRRLRETGAADTAPAAFARSIADRARRDAAQNLLVDAETERVLRRLDALNVPSVLIKGIARRVAAERWPYADARATHDVDVIVPAADAEKVWRELLANGYRRYSDATSPHQLPGVIGAGQVSVDIHTSLGHTLPASEAWQRATTGALLLEFRGMQVRVPCATELLWHGLTHALQHGVPAWRLRFLLDGAAILATSDDIAWDRVVARVGGAETDPVAATHWLGAAAQLAGVELPASLRGDASCFDLSRMLRWRLGVLARGVDAGLAGRLLEEGTRVELGLGVTPIVGGASPLRQARRWVAGRVARVTYRAWRAAARARAQGGSG